MNLSFEQILTIILGGCALFYLVMYMLLKRHNKKERIKETGIEEKGKIRYTVKETPVEELDEETGKIEANVSYIQKDILLKRGYKYVVSLKGKVKPGKYTLLTTEDNIKEFNIRRNAYVRNYEHNSGMVLAEGDEITAINIPIILR